LFEVAHARGAADLLLPLVEASSHGVITSSDEALGIAHGRILGSFAHGARRSSSGALTASAATTTELCHAAMSVARPESTGLTGGEPRGNAAVDARGSAEIGCPEGPFRG
jgi:hypothetical protein